MENLTIDYEEVKLCFVIHWFLNGSVKRELFA